MLSEKEKLTQIINLGQEIAKVQDVDILLERILTEARRLVNADAGSIYIKENNRLKFSHTQNETMQKRLPVGKKLLYTTFSIPINNESLAAYVAATGKMLQIPNAYELPRDVPYAFDRQYDEISNYRTQSVLAAPLLTYRDDVVGVLQLINAKDSTGNIIPFAKDDEPLVLHFANTAAIAIERAQMIRTIILRMIKVAELRDPKETGAHVNRVASYTVEIYEAWASRRGDAHEVIERNKDILRMAAMLHDVGKIAIADAILKKPAKLDTSEFTIMKQHTYLGARLFSETYSDFDEAAFSVTLNHHERWDGQGYPGHINPLSGKPIPGYENSDGTAQGKRGEEIPPFGRLVTIADVYDALSSRRSYKDPWDEAKVLETFKQGAGKQFDPEMVAAFFARLDVIRSIADRYPDG